MFSFQTQYWKAQLLHTRHAILAFPLQNLRTTMGHFLFWRAITMGLAHGVSHADRDLRLVLERYLKLTLEVTEESSMHHQPL